MSEVTDPKNQFAYSEPKHITDWAQLKISAAQEKYRKAHPDADMSALIWLVEKL